MSKDYNSLEEQVLRTLLYFDIFSYPLKPGEVCTFLQTQNHISEVTECLNELAEKKLIFRFGDFYSLGSDRNDIDRRIKGNNEAERWLVIARKQARFIARFPFVRGVMASGSLSKGYMDENSDLDFFVITAPGGLWIARTLLVLYKRAFLFNSHKRFCVNYFVDQHHLEIEERNLFTATELATLIPLYCYESYEAVLNSNRWTKDYFPNFKRRPARDDSRPVNTVVGRTVEYLLQPITFRLDRLLMQISLRRWRRLYANNYSSEDFDIAFKSRRYVSKNHPNHYQKKILELYQRKVAEFQHRIAETTYE